MTEAGPVTPLRIGLMLDSMRQPAWCRDIIESIRQAPHTELALLIVNAADPYPPPRDFFDRFRRVRPHLLYTLYERFDRRRFGRSPDPFEEAPIDELVAGVPVVHVRPRMTKFSDYFEDADVATIRSHELDVAIRFGFRILRGESLRIARYGVWSYHHADNHVNRGGPPGFWEVANGEPVTGSVLQILTEELDGGVVLYRSHAATDLHSLYRNRCNYYAKTAAFIPRVLRDLHACGESVLSGTDTEYVAYDRPLYRTPSNREMVSFLTRLGGRFLRAKRNALLFHDQWALAYRFRKQGDEAGSPDATMHGFKLIRSPRDRFWADPFPLEHEGRYSIFFEEYVYSEGRGRICVFDVDPKTGHGERRVALERPYHLSFPNVFRHDGQLYMLPETGEARQVELYRCERFPDVWVLDRVLLENIHAVDPVVFRHGDRWWMFVGTREPGTDSWDELSLFHAPDLKGPWRPHPRNPVKSDVRAGRPAGQVFAWRGELYRPAQDCSVRYGGGMSIQKITRLDLTGYEETETTRIGPHWDRRFIGTHTLNSDGRLTVTDVLWRKYRWSD